MFEANWKFVRVTVFCGTYYLLYLTRCHTGCWLLLKRGSKLSLGFIVWSFDACPLLSDNVASYSSILMHLNQVLVKDLLIKPHFRVKALTRQSLVAITYLNLTWLPIGIQVAPIRNKLDVSNILFCGKSFRPSNDKRKLDSVHFSGTVNSTISLFYSFPVFFC